MAIDSRLLRVSKALVSSPRSALLASSEAEPTSSLEKIEFVVHFCFPGCEVSDS